jgi:NADPH:quinone reductase-like Zn-dependent oxidoreductase
MKALLSHAPGAGLSLDEVPDPVAGPGELLIAVRAVGVNYPDVLIIEDQYQFKPPRPFAPGGELAGVVEAVGPGVTGWAVGDRAIAVTGWGGMAERVAVPAASCIRMPEAMGFEDGAALLMTYGTSQHALADRAGLKPGETLLVLGAAGGVGLAAVELGKAMGARVVAACSTEEKAAVARERGADETVVYGAGPVDGRALAGLFKAACPKGADVVFDPVGGDLAEPAIRSLAPLGRHLVIGFPGGIPKLPLNLLLLKEASAIGVFWGAFVARDPARHAANVAELFRMHAVGAIRPLISARYALADGADAVRELAERRATGKVVVTVG